MVAPPPNTCVDVTLVARREYRPTGWTDAAACWAQPIHFPLPSALAVTQGGASNKSAWLFATAAGHTTACRYVGTGQPGGHGKLGGEYRLACCTRRLRAGDILAADSVRLHVHNGEQKAGTTEVSWRLQETAPCTGGGTDGGVCAAWPEHLHGDEEDVCDGRGDDDFICTGLESDNEWGPHHGE